MTTTAPLTGTTTGTGAVTTGTPVPVASETPPATARARTGDGHGAVDVHVSGGVRIRLIGATPADRAAVERQFGPAVPAGDEPAALQIEYVEEIPDGGSLRHLGPGEQGFTDDGFYVVRGRFRRPVRVRLAFGPRNVTSILCEHGVGRVPHLVALVNLAVLDAGGVALHASGFRVPGGALLATGWSKGGKTEALLAAGRLGATFLADEWAHLHPDGTASGTCEPIRLWDWHLDQLPEVRSSLPRSDRRRLAVLSGIRAAAGAVRTSARVTTAIDRLRHVDAVPEILDPRALDTSPAPVRGIYLMTSADQTGCTLHSVSTEEVADRMAASLAFERSDLAGLLAAHRYAFPHRETPSVDDLEIRERARLRDLLDGLPAVEVRHPHHVDLTELGRAMRQMGSWWS